LQGLVGVYDISDLIFEFCLKQLHRLTLSPFVLFFFLQTSLLQLLERHFEFSL
jgi:hypothetical protein